MLVPTRLVAREVLARMGDPLLWSFVQHAQQRDDAWAVALLDRITACCGTARPDIWTLELRASAAPALGDRLGDLDIGTLLHDPQDRARPLDVVPLLIRRGDRTLVAPDDDEVLHAGDRLLLVGMAYDRRALDTTCSVPAAAEYVLTGERVGQSWIWRTLVDR